MVAGQIQGGEVLVLLESLRQLHTHCTRVKTAQVLSLL